LATLGDIETATKKFSESRGRLSEYIHNAEAEIEGVKKRYLPIIKKWIAQAAAEQAILEALIRESPELFDKPRTIVLFGIKVGLGKGKGKIEWEDDSSVVRLIKRHFPEQAEILIKTTEKPVKKALGQLCVADLRKLGVLVEETDDQVIVKSVDSDIDKLVARLLKDAGEIEEAA
jgi:hypothetical protein